MNLLTLGTCEKLASRNTFTPDFPKLRLQNHILVFNYFKPFKIGGRFQPLLRPTESAYLGKAYTIMDNYVVKEAQNDSDIRVCFKNDKVPPANFSPLFRSHVKGELYALSPEALLNMDRIMKNNHHFYREEKYVVPTEQASVFKDDGGTTVRAFMYFGVEEFWENYPLVKARNLKDNDIGKWMWL